MTRTARRRPLALAAALTTFAAVALAASAGAGVTAPAAAPVVPSYTNYAMTTMASPPSTEIGYDAGEPSIGADFPNDKIMYQAVLQTIQASFDDKTVPATVAFKDVTNPIEGVQTLDPILFTDSPTGRTFVSQLVPPCSVSSFTDTAGENTVPGVPGSGYTTSTGCGLGANFDHQAFSAGIAPEGFPTTYTGPDGEARTVYYCSQVVVEATCARSVDGGITFGQSAVAYDLGLVTNGCTGLHGHLKVSPKDGTAYLPNFECFDPDGGPKAALVVAEPGPVLEFEIRRLPESTTTADFDSDPSVGIDTDGTAYMAWEDADSNMMVAVTKDRAVTYTDIQDLGAPFGIKNATMPAAVGGSAGRAAVAFLGSPTEAPAATDGKPENQLRSFAGDWHLYVSTTYDSGKNWVTVDATPTDPVQRGCIWWGNVAADRIPAGDATCTSNPDRNLLDFMDVTVDETGRVVVGYADGCVAACITDKTSRARDDNGTIARQTCGRGLFAEFDSSADGPLVACGGRVTRPAPQPSGSVGGGGTDVVPATPLSPASPGAAGGLAATGLPFGVPAAAVLLGAAALVAVRARRTA